MRAPAIVIFKCIKSISQLIFLNNRVIQSFSRKKRMILVFLIEIHLYSTSEDAASR